MRLSFLPLALLAACALLTSGVVSAQSIGGVGALRITGDCTGLGTSSVNVSCPPNLSNAINLLPTLSYQYPTVVKASGYLFSPAGENGYNILFEGTGGGTFTLFDTQSGGLNTGVTFQMTNQAADLQPLNIAAPGSVTVNGVPGTFTVQYGQTWLFTTDGANYFATLSGYSAYMLNLAGAAQTGSLLVRINSAGRATAVTAGATDGAVGIRNADGTSSSVAMVTTVGMASCVFDNATTAGHWVTISATVNGNCTDTGVNTRPTASQPIGVVVESGGAGIHRLVLQLGGTGGGGGGGGVSSVSPGAGIATTNAGGQSAITSTGSVFADASFFPLSMGGLTLANDSVTPNTVIDTARGAATDDSSTVLMKLAGAVTKNANTAWAAGSGNGCLSADVTPPLANTTWYHLFLIENAGTGAVDELCSSSVNPQLPAGYGYKRRIGSFATDGSAHIRAFTQAASAPDRPLFYWTTATFSHDTTLSTAAVLETLDVPLGIAVQPLCRVNMQNGATAAILLTSPAETDVAPNTQTPFTAAPGYDRLDATLTAGQDNATCPPLLTNTASQVRARATAASTTVGFITRGWFDSFAAPPIPPCTPAQLSFNVACNATFYTIGVN